MKRTDEELQALRVRCAELMGYEWWTVYYEGVGESRLVDEAHASAWANQPNDAKPGKLVEAISISATPNYSTSRDAAAELLADVERRGLWERFATSITCSNPVQMPDISNAKSGKLSMIVIGVTAGLRMGLTATADDIADAYKQTREATDAVDK